MTMSRIAQAEDLLNVALSHLNGEPEYANKQVVINYLQAYFDARRLEQEDEFMRELKESERTDRA